MKTVTLFTVNPSGAEEPEDKKMAQFAQELDQFYQIFHMNVKFASYEKALHTNSSGKYSVKELRSAVYDMVEESALFSMIFYCKKEDLAQDEAAVLMQNLQRQNKAGIVLYFKIEENMQPVRNDMYRRVVQVNESIELSKEDCDRLAALAGECMNRGYIFEKQNKLTEAENLYHRCQLIWRRLIKVDEEKYLPALPLPCHNLAVLNVRKKQFKEAEFMYREVIGMSKRLIDIKGDSFLSLLASGETNLAGLYAQTERVEDAEKLYLNALEIATKLAVSKERSSMMLLSDVYTSLGSMYKQQKQNDKAIEMLDHALSTCEELLAQKEEEALQLKTARTANTLGEMYREKGMFQEAELRYLSSLNCYKKLVEVNAKAHEPHMALTCYNLGALCGQLKRAKEADVYLKNAYEISGRHKEENQLCADIWNAIEKGRQSNLARSQEQAAELEKNARAKQEAGVFDAAATAFEQAAFLYQQTKTQESLEKAALIYTELGLLYWDMMNLDAAERSYKNALNIYNAIAAANPKKTANAAVAYYNLGLFYQDTRDEEVNDQLRMAYKLAGQCLSESEACREIYENLEEDCGEQKESQETEDVKEEAEPEEVEVKEEAQPENGGWLKRLFGKKK